MTDSPRRGRPDDVRRALLQAAIDLKCEARYPTLRELVRQARVGSSSGLNAVKNMRRCGLLVVAGERRVSYRNRPVAEYAAACPLDARPADAAVHYFADLLSAWQ